MSVVSTRPSYRRRQPRYQSQLRYQPFALPEGVGTAGAAGHLLAWLLGNLDWLLQHGSATHSRALIALHRDLQKLAAEPGSAGAAVAIPAEPAPPAPEFAELQRIHHLACEEFYATAQHVSTAKLELGKLIGVLGRDIMNRPEVRTQVFEVRRALDEVPLPVKRF